MYFLGRLPGQSTILSLQEVTYYSFRMRKVIGILLLLVGLALSCYMGIAVLWQHAAITRFVPVPCSILSSKVNVHRGRHTSYSPSISYCYTYHDRAYQSSCVLPYEENGDVIWANGIVSRYTQAGRGAEGLVLNATAYVNPEQPEESVLERMYSGTPYFFCTVGLLLIGIGVGLLTGLIGGERETMAAVPLDDSGIQLLLPARPLRAILREAIAILMAALIAVVPPAAHWLLAARQSMNSNLGLLIVGEGIVLLVLAVKAFNRWNVCRRLSDARLRVRPAPMVRGQVFTMEMEVDAYSPLRVRKSQARVRCVEHYKEKRGNKTATGTRTKGEQTADLSDAAKIPAGQLLPGKAELFFPANELPPTSDLSTKLYPYYTWEIHVHIDLEGMADYRAVFPLAVD
jgi:hypothetical protein